MNAGLTWSDLELMLRLADACSLKLAGDQLKVDATTVSRRLSRIEHQMRIKAFDRVDGRLMPTPALIEALPALRAMQEAAQVSNAALNHSKAELSSRVRISSLGFIFSHFLAPAAAELQSAHPRLSVDFIAEDRSVSFERREADIAVRLARPSSGTAKVKRLRSLSFKLYTPALMKTQFQNTGTPSVVRYDEDLDNLPEMQLLNSLRPGARVALRSNRLDILTVAALSLGADIMLPDCLGETDPRFALAHPSGKSAEREVFLMMHEERIETASVRAVADWISQCMITRVGGNA